MIPLTPFERLVERFMAFGPDAVCELLMCLRDGPMSEADMVEWICQYLAERGAA